ncbi:MAG TPA: FecR family protein [Methylocella sp.]|nr:FecR family protein [Methylocella sp.]
MARLLALGRPWLAGPALCCLIAAFAPSANAAQPVGEVNWSRGSAFLERETGKQSATPGTGVLLDDLALTGEDARLDLRLGKATRLRLGPSASLKIDKFVAGIEAVTTLEDGPLVVSRQKGAEPKFEVKTPYAVLAARGTNFFAGPSRGVFAVFVQSGTVEVRTQHGSVEVQARHGIEIKAPGEAPNAPVCWEKVRINTAFNSVR